MPVLSVHAQPESIHACQKIEELRGQLQRIYAPVGAPIDRDIEEYFRKYCYRRYEQKVVGYSADEFYRRFLIYDKGHKMGAKISDGLALMNLVSSFEEKQTKAFKLAVESVEEFCRELNTALLDVHPNPVLSRSRILMNSKKGEGIKIAVFDVFEPRLLEAQRKHYSSSRILETQTFGKPVHLSHGNIVIDVILSIAPGAQILPVSSDTGSSVNALDYIRQQDDLLIVNMSRALVPSRTRSKIESSFKEELKNLVKHKILVKSLGNSGTDLKGLVSPARQELGLGVAGDLSGYDAGLISDFLIDIQDDLLVLVENLDIEAKSAALSATIPGDNDLALLRTVAAPGEGFYSFSTSNFESGSSFAAPMVSAILALLLETQSEKFERINLFEIVSSLGSHEEVLSGDDSLLRLMN